MTELKLPRLPDRTSVRIGIAVPPELSRALADYAALYKETYGREESVADLVPAMLSSFLESDRGFAKARRKLAANASVPKTKELMP